MDFASQLFVSEEDEQAFRKAVQDLLRSGNARAALAEVDAKLRDVAGTALADLALLVAPESVSMRGWNGIGDTIASLDRHGQPISAVGIDFTDPVRAGRKPDAQTMLEPVLDTAFYCDEAFAFSTSDRDTLHAAYAVHGPRWMGAYEHREHKVQVAGLDVLYGAIHAARPHAEDGPRKAPADHDAARLAAMRCAVLLHMAVARAVEAQGLPRPLVVMCGSDNDLPSLEAVVVTREEYEDAADAQAESGDIDESLFTSLVKIAPVRQNATYHFTPETEHLSGRSLRHRLMQEKAGNDEEEVLDLSEVVAAEEVRGRQSLLGKLLRRSA